MFAERRATPRSSTVRTLATIPIEGKAVKGGFHIVTVTGKTAQRSTRVVDVFPDTLSVISVAAIQSGAGDGNAADDVFASLLAYVPGANVVVAGDVIAIHGHGLELQCRLARATTRSTANREPSRSRRLWSAERCTCRYRFWSGSRRTAKARPVSWPVSGPPRAIRPGSRRSSCVARNALVTRETSVDFNGVAMNGRSQ